MIADLFQEYDELWLKVSKLEKSLQNKDLNTSLKILKELVPEWSSKLYA